MLLRAIIAIVLAALAAACSGVPGTTVVLREGSDGHTGFHSRTRALPGHARFECLASDSGRCHYAVFGGVCAGLSAALGDGRVRCAEDVAPRLQFDLKVGEHRSVGGLPLGFRHCASGRRGPVTAACLRYGQGRSPSA
ncbi:hypothetical protein [Marilutibacter maris]|uniref:Lipoprotein n=1 Tax=Marilutibacter maris TaxID=1605891 RepID=A0A2U9TBS8_9GAMM|nr:hypothetical protein [Lysobacter maris]AWV05760.1 hypothetical protein C9I47_0034 [Lysobacter maris]